MSSQWVIHKFGGTSLADAARYRRVAEIMQREKGEKKAIVVSAMSKVTDALIELVDLAKTRNDAYLARADALKARHVEAVEALLPPERRQALLDLLESDFNDIKDVLRGVYLSRTCSDRTLELISGHGELWSAQLLNAHLNAIGVPSTCLDARTVLTVEPGDTTVSVDWERSKSQTAEWLKALRTDWVVVTGFVASTPDGIPTTLKRNGSDFSASIFGKLLEARAITIWTDVDGVLSADPRLVPDAVVLEEVSYQEATELAYFGAKVVHPSTMAPAIENKIPIWIRNTFNPSAPGTKIHEKAASGHAGQGVRHGRRHGARERRRHRHDRRAGRGPSALRRAPGRGRFRRHDLAGQLRAFDLFRDPRSPGRPRADDRRARVLRRASSQPDPDDRRDWKIAASSPRWATTWSIIPGSPESSSPLSARPRSTFAPSRRAPPNEISRP